jgi:hypothetical protein
MEITLVVFGKGEMGSELEGGSCKNRYRLHFE